MMPNNDGKVDIMDTQNINGKGQFEAQSYVYETVKKQTDLVEAGVKGLNRTNYLNSEIKLVDELAIFSAYISAYFIKDGPFIVQSFGAKLAQLGANYVAQQTLYKLFSTISKKLLPSNTKYVLVHVEQQEFSAMCLFKDMYDKSSAVQVAVSGQLNMFDCEFQGTYILDNYTNSTNTNESAPNEASTDSFIDEVIIKHEKQLGYAVFPFTGEVDHHYSIKEIKLESQKPPQFDKKMIISLSDTDHDITQTQNSFLSVVQTATIQLDDKFDKIDKSYQD
ncbi:MAG: hypothetical protein EZS28_001434 [Streblomastix strix]|uniref:Uncharacterized protein n=1 Tax=Streblomastix strix TaxID=222440 RepID=A0A5J4X708_9EUKA|nr:MAG: hypothetical protein EZS28_001434 [Streblomastix strix]